MKFDLKNPCGDCPFRTDRPKHKGWLGAARAKDICESLIDKQATFQCHKTIGLDKDKKQHCAGAMIMLEHMELPNQMMRIAKRLHLYNRSTLNMNAPVVTTDIEFIEIHED